MKPSILVDAREFVPGRFTGIGRVLAGLVHALAVGHPEIHIVLATRHLDAVPEELGRQPNIQCRSLPSAFPVDEWMLTRWTKSRCALYISPYPKLPMFGCSCLAIHTVHDVLDLTHPAYRKTRKAGIDRLRLKVALNRADLTWYDSNASLLETRRLVGIVGRNPKVRHLAVSERFSNRSNPEDVSIWNRYRLRKGYILVLGNGLPHKNLGVLLEIADQVNRPFVFVGVPERNYAHWYRQFPDNQGTWLSHIRDGDLPAVLRGAFCLAQPSTAEGYGYPPLEAMASGIPAVVSDIPVLREITGEKAIVARAEDPQAWLAAFRRLEDPDRRSRQIKKGRRWIEPILGKQGWENHIDDVFGLMEGPCRRKRHLSQE